MRGRGAGTTAAAERTTPRDAVHALRSALLRVPYAPSCPGPLSRAFPFKR